MSSRILLVEDNEMNRDMLSRRLSRRGFAVSVAIDGQDGLDKVRAEALDLVLLDMDLPVIDGWEVARRLKAAGDTAGIPIIALTAHAMVGDRDRALEAGCDDYDVKPVEFPRLLEKIDALLGSREGA
jgi:two-component system cell cycle response regulator DivK